MIQIDRRRWLAVWYRCSGCGAQRGHPRLTPTNVHRSESFAPVCSSWGCARYDQPMAIAERRYYTTFCIEPGVSFTTVAGTLDKIGPFKVCDIVHPNWRVFRKWYRERKAELDEQTRQYFEHERKVQAEYEAKMERQRKERILLKQVEAVAYRREHAAEMEAEAVAKAAWPEEEKPVEQPIEKPFFLNDDGFDFDDAPF